MLPSRLRTAIGRRRKRAQITAAARWESIRCAPLTEQEQLAVQEFWRRQTSTPNWEFLPLNRTGSA